MEMQTTNRAKLFAASSNNRFHGAGSKVPANSKRETGELIISRGDGTALLYRNGRFIAIIKEA